MEADKRVEGNAVTVLYDLWPKGETYAAGIEIKKDKDPKVFLYVFEALSLFGGNFADINFTDKKNVFGQEVIELEFIEFNETWAHEQTEKIADYINQKFTV